MLSSCLLRDKSCVFFRSSAEVDAASQELTKLGWIVLQIDGSRWAVIEDAFRAFAFAMQVPIGYYGVSETFAPNANAFLEYLDDVQEWLPAKGHLYVVQRAAELMRNAPEIVGAVVELIQFSHLDRGSPWNSDAKLVFVLEESNA